ncbi:HTTM domain-containing protein [Natrinema halophilum]|uniref:HTTM domain-containing protein n=1 Tax=Natrinema halophilum TaxID=1699371 RepID=A0A7D5KKJ5_9EURY|nr:HTTM domain-containing protein [Natrinema halophilum]QLG50499.1 HTTM domain-containing protein [Natrinema halophilum]
MSKRNTSFITDSSPTDVIDRISQAITRRFAVDTRALAAFRIALGLLLIADLAARSRNLGAFYTDSGVLPRTALYSDYSTVYSLHAVSGEAWAISLLFVVAAAFAVAVIVGYRTRVAIVCSWLLLLSLHVRNPMVLNGGDVLLRMLVFWAMFLPLDERWAVDASPADSDRATVSNVATMALLLQVVVMYVANAIHKTDGEMWLNGEAVVYVFSLDYQFTILLGNVLAEYHDLLRLMTYLWVALVICAPLLLILTGLPRALLASGFVGMHVGMLATMRIGLFPLIVVAAFIPFYPPTVWNWISALASRIGLAQPLHRWLRRLDAVVPDRPAAGRGGIALPGPRNLLSAGLEHGRAVFSTALPALFLVLIVLSNAQAVGYTQVPDPGESVLDATETDQSWRMFAPEPLQTDGWYVVPGELENGTEVDAMYESEVSWEPPPDGNAVYPSARWRKYLSNVWGADNTNHRSYLGNYLCDRWNRNHGTNLEEIQIYYVAQPSQPYNETEPTNEIMIKQYNCSGDLVQ